MSFDLTSSSLCTIACAASELGALEMLTPGEHDEWTAFRSAERRRDWLYGRVAAKRAVGARMGIDDLRRLVVSPRDRSAPVCSERDGGPLPVALSITHAAGRALAAAAPLGDRVGIDLERAGAIAAHHEHLFVGPAERDRSPDVDPTVRWVLKEAAWKAFCCPQRLPLRALELELDRTSALCAVVIAGVRQPARGRLLSVWPGFVAALVHVSTEVMCA